MIIHIPLMGKMKQRAMPQGEMACDGSQESQMLVNCALSYESETTVPAPLFVF